MGWFDLSEVRTQAQDVADEYARLRASAATLSMKDSRQARRFERPTARAVAYMGSLGFNLYKKSRFLQLLRAALAERKVPDDEAEAFARAVMVGPLAPLRTK